MAGILELFQFISSPSLSTDTASFADARQNCADLGTDVCSARLLGVDSLESVVTSMEGNGVTSGTYTINAKYNSIKGGWTDEDTAELVLYTYIPKAVSSRMLELDM